MSDSQNPEIVEITKRLDAVIEENEKLRIDGWANVLSGMGTKARDKKQSTAFAADVPIPKQELEEMYDFDGLARKTIDIVANDMTRKWITVEGDPAGHILRYMRGIKTRKAFNSALKTARLYGGSLIFIGANDGQDPELKLNEDNIKTIEKLIVYSSEEVVFEQPDTNRDPTSPDFGKVEVFTIVPENNSQRIRIHSSRLLPFVGEEVPKSKLDIYRGFGASALQLVYVQLRDLMAGMSHSGSIVEEFITGKLKISNLKDLIAQDGNDDLKTRLQLMDLSKSILRMVILGDNESYEKEASSVAGLADIVDRFMMMYSAVTNIPVTRLFGKSSAGLNTTNEGDEDNYNDWISGKQEDEMRDPLERLTDLILVAKDFEHAGDIDEWNIVFRSLEELSEKEAAEVKKSTAEADKIYIDTGVLTADEVALSRFGGDTYSTDTKINRETRAGTFEDE